MTDIEVINLGFVNAYLMKAKKGFVLIDSGLPFQWAILKNRLDELGVKKGNLRLVVLTHGDMDHIGNAQRLRQDYRSRIAIHKADSPMVEKGQILSRKGRTLGASLMMLLMRLRRNKSMMHTFKPDIYLKEGDSLSKYGIEAKILHLPGHTPGSIGILTKSGELIAGDTFTNQKKPERAVFIENPQQLKSSIRRLKSLKIVKVYPGHGSPFAGRELKKIKA